MVRVTRGRLWLSWSVIRRALFSLAFFPPFCVYVVWYGMPRRDERLPQFFQRAESDRPRKNCWRGNFCRSYRRHPSSCCCCCCCCKIIIHRCVDDISIGVVYTYYIHTLYILTELLLLLLLCCLPCVRFQRPCHSIEDSCLSPLCKDTIDWLFDSLIDW